MFIKDFLFPKFCLGCGFVGAYLCPNCQKKLIPVRKEECLYCQKPSPFGLTHQKCERKYGIDGVMAIFYYNDFLKKIIKTIKYRLAKEVFNELFNLIEPWQVEKILFYKHLLSQKEKNSFLQPIPLHQKKEKERGFNQAKIIAQFFQRILPYRLGDFLIRKKETKSQTQTKNKKERYFNIKGAFAINPNYKERLDSSSFKLTVVLIDDVFTSGWTIRQAGQVLKQTGVERVFVLTLAKG